LNILHQVEMLFYLLSDLMKNIVVYEISSEFQFY